MDLSTAFGGFERFELGAEREVYPINFFKSVFPDWKDFSLSTRSY